MSKGGDSTSEQPVPTMREPTNAEAIASPSGPSIVADLSWKPEELRLRKKEVQGSWIATFVQAFTAIAALVASYAAVSAANSATSAVQVSQESSEAQSVENRVATAINAVGSDRPAAQIAGISILERVVRESLDEAADGTPAERERAHGLYLTGLQVVGGYLKSFPADVPVQPLPGTPPRSSEDPVQRQGRTEAAGTLRRLLAARDEVVALSSDRPSVDVASVALPGVSWPNTDFSWLAGRYLSGIDLRVANLRGSRFTELPPATPDGRFAKTNLNSASMQCANLSAVDFTGATLTNADLRNADLSGANLTGANLTNANLAEAKLTGATVTGAQGLTLDPGQQREVTSPAPAARETGPRCSLSDQRYWRRQPQPIP